MLFIEKASTIIEVALNISSLCLLLCILRHMFGAELKMKDSCDKIIEL